MVVCCSPFWGIHSFISWLDRRAPEADARFTEVPEFQPISRAGSTPADVAVGRGVALAHWQVGEWSNGRYAEYLEATWVDDDPTTSILIARLLNC